MKTKVIVIVGVTLTVGVTALYFWLERKKVKTEQNPEHNEQPGWKPKTPEALLKRLVEDILGENIWKNERDFLSTLTKLYIKEVPEIGWIDYLPMNQEDLLLKLDEIGCLEEYEKELEAKYK